MMQDELTINDVYVIHSLCLQDSLSLKEISHSFAKSLQPDKRSRLRVGTGLVTMLRELDLVSCTKQRLVLEWLIYLLFEEPVTANPFLCVMLRLMKKPSTEEEDLLHWPVLTPPERYLLGNLLTGGTHEVLSRTPGEIAELVWDKEPVFDLAKLEQIVIEQQMRFPIASKAAVLPIMRIADHSVDNDPTYCEQQTLLSTCEALLTGEHAAMFGETMPPPFLRLPPPAHPALDEYEFVYPLLLSPLWMPSDATCSSGDSVSSAVASAPARVSESSEAGNVEVQATGEKCKVGRDWEGKTTRQTDEAKEDEARVELMRRALAGVALSQTDTRSLTEALKADPSLLRVVEMSPEKLPRLVEENPRIAVEVLYNLIQTKEISTYFEALVSMDLSVSGMEVVNRLTSMVEVPVEFLNFYASHCIRSCEQIRNPFNQNRLVRLVCVFLSSLIRNGLINVKDLFAELQAFCLNFTPAKEAAALYQTVQMLVRDEKNNEDPSGL